MEKTQPEIDTFIDYLREVKDSEEQFRILFEVNFDGICINRLPDGEFVKVNPGFSKMTGYEEYELYGLLSKEINIWHEPEDRLFVLEQLQIKGLLRNFEGRFRTKSGEIRYGLLSAIIVTIKNTPHIISIIHDITEQKNLEEKLRESEKKYRELSNTDSLTGLGNSRYYHSQITTEITKASSFSLPLSLILIDVDNFKKLNDTFGHVIGDNVLSQLGQIIKESIRQTDLPFRYGGEEFVIVLTSTKKADACRVAEKIRKGFEKQNFSTTEGLAITATISAGVVEYQEPETSKSFIDRADKLMYRAKSSGKNTICHRS